MLIVTKLFALPYRT